MAKGARLLMCAAGTAAIVATVLAPSVANGELGTSRSAQVVPQRIVLQAPEPATPVQDVVQQRVTTARSASVRAVMAGTEATTRECANSAGAETKLGMLQHSAAWGHCEAIP
jgi:hypothetical protein